MDSINFFKTACYFESSLILVAMFLGWIADIDPVADLYFSETAVLYGLFGTIPLFMLYLATDYLDFDAVQQIRKLLQETLAEKLASYHWTDLLILAAIAGIAEEMLFRGVLQPWIERAWGLSIGLLASSVIFGLVHAVTPLYAILAVLVSMYLGLSLDYGSSRNLLTPIIIHALYDFLAFLALIRTYKAQA